MLSKGLYKSVLIDPLMTTDANKLYIVSGYASATFARRHLLDLLKIDDKVQVNLIVGMPGNRSDHVAFLQLHKEFEDRFHGYYIGSAPPVHSKVYSWFKDSSPVQGFAGSANYSQYGFFESQQVNQISNEKPDFIKTFYDELLERSVYMPNMKIVLPEGHRNPGIVGSIPAGQINWEIPDKRVTISFLDKKGELPAISGLNWGKRLEKRINKKTGELKLVRRDPNQAYLSLKQDARKDGFLPERAFNFTLVTDDGKTFDCVVAQDGRKSIQTTNDNSLLGAYVRERIGVPSGELVTVEDLERYGRTDYTIEKIDDETFLLDFSSRK